MANTESQARNTIDKHMTNATDEAAFVKILIDKLTKDDAIFVSNSMPVRDIDNLLYNSEVEVCESRCKWYRWSCINCNWNGVHKKITLIIGDLAFYHDMNGLLMAKINNINLNIVLLNNDGGGIFSYLPQKHLLKHILNVCLERRLD